jgi:hypothetical protein
VNMGPKSPNTKLPPLPPSITHLAGSHVLITLSGLGSQLAALPPAEELELEAELATELDDELTATELEDELTTELDEELTATELDAELTATELADETTVTELELLDFLLLLLPPQAVIKTLSVSTTANCFTIMVYLLVEKRQQTSDKDFAVARVVIRYLCRLAKLESQFF